MRKREKKGNNYKKSSVHSHSPYFWLNKLVIYYFYSLPLLSSCKLYTLRSVKTYKTRRLKYRHVTLNQFPPRCANGEIVRTVKRPGSIAPVHTFHSSSFRNILSGTNRKVDLSTLHLDGWNFISFKTDHSNKLSRSLCK